jgi:DNA-binding MarR family transcriptional regulator
MSSLKSSYTKVPDEIISLNLPSSVLRVMLHLLRWQNAEKHFESYATIAFHCGLGDSTVKKAIKYLEKLNFITIISRQVDRKTNLYKINFEQIDGHCVLTTEERELREINLQRINMAKKEREIKEKIKKGIANKENFEKDDTYVS